jgi:hypothetical protein
VRRLYWAAIIVLVCVLAGCQGAQTPASTATASPTTTFVSAPTITATNTPSPEPTATQPPTPMPTPTCAPAPTSPIPQEAKEYFSEAYRLWADEKWDAPPLQLVSNLISGTLAYANVVLDPATPLEAQQDALDALSTWIRYDPYCMESCKYLDLDLFDLDGDGRSEGVFRLFRCLMGGPSEFAFVLYSDGKEYTIHPLFPRMRYKHEDPFLCRECNTRVERVGDINGDGKWEAQILLVIFHADGFSFEPLILWWTPDNIETLFDQEFSWWKQQVYWQVNDNGTIVVDEPYLSFYCEVGSLLGTTRCRRQITTYRWVDGVYRVDSTVVTPPQTTFQQFEIAEELLYAGRYEQALGAYKQLVDQAIPLSEPQSDIVEWRPAGWLRLGTLYACLGDGENARNAMISAQAAGVDYAGVYLESYAETNSTIDALFALWRATKNTTYDGRLVEITPPSLCLEAYLVAYSHQTADEIFQGLNALGFEVTTVIADDLDGDGLREIIVTKPWGSYNDTLWLLVQCGSGWMAIRADIDTKALVVKEIVDVPGTSTKAMALTCGDGSCGYAAIGWNGNTPVFYKDTDTFETAEPVGYYSYYRTGWDDRRCDD